MLKQDHNYVINGESAKFNATVERGLMGLFPVAEFTFPDGKTIRVVHNSLKGTSTASDLMDRVIAYRNGSWRFV